MRGRRSSCTGLPPLIRVRSERFSLLCSSVGCASARCTVVGSQQQQHCSSCMRHSASAFGECSGFACTPGLLAFNCGRCVVGGEGLSAAQHATASVVPGDRESGGSACREGGERIVTTEVFMDRPLRCLAIVVVVAVVPLPISSSSSSSSSASRLPLR